MNAYGHHLIASDVLQVERDLGVWDQNRGLLRDDGITLTAAHFGFNAIVNRTRTLDDIIEMANKGTPVIVSVRDNNYFQMDIFCDSRR